MCFASYPVIYLNQEKVTGSVGLSNNVKIGGFRHPSLFSRRGDGGEVLEKINVQKKHANRNQFIARQERITFVNIT